jgi:hypothetical protein
MIDLFFQKTPLWPQVTGLVTQDGGPAPAGLYIQSQNRALSEEKLVRFSVQAS